MMLSNLKIPKVLRRIIDNELQPGEFIRWVEQPMPRFSIDVSCLSSFYVGIIPTCIGAAFMWNALSVLPNLREGLQSQHLFALLLGLALALVGLPVFLEGLKHMFNPFWAWQAARKTVYLVTDKRAISIQGGSSFTIRSFLPGQLIDVYRDERADGTGDVILVIQRWRDSEGHQVNEVIEVISFWGIRNPREGEKMLRQLVENNA